MNGLNHLNSNIVYNSCTRHVLMCFVLSCKNNCINFVKCHIFFII